jgi:hypothetical protein
MDIWNPKIILIIPKSPKKSKNLHDRIIFWAYILAKQMLNKFSGDIYDSVQMILNIF